jgi:hypothetical protein
VVREGALLGRRMGAAEKKNDCNVFLESCSGLAEVSDKLRHVMLLKDGCLIYTAAKT